MPLQRGVGRRLLHGSSSKPCWYGVGRILGDFPSCFGPALPGPPSDPRQNLPRAATQNPKVAPILADFDPSSAQRRRQCQRQDRCAEFRSRGGREHALPAEPVSYFRSADAGPDAVERREDHNRVPAAGLASALFRQQRYQIGTEGRRPAAKALRELEAIRGSREQVVGPSGNVRVRPAARSCGFARRAADRSAAGVNRRGVGIGRNARRGWSHSSTNARSKLPDIAPESAGIGTSLVKRGRLRTKCVRDRHTSDSTPSSVNIGPSVPGQL